MVGVWLAGLSSVDQVPGRGAEPTSGAEGLEGRGDAKELEMAQGPRSRVI